MRRGRRAVLALATAAAAILCPPGTHAQSPLSTRLIDAKVIRQMREHMTAPIVIMTLRGTNATRQTLTQAEVEALDTIWREQREADVKPLIASTLSTPLSNYLTRIQAHSTGLIVEIIVVGNKGLNAGQSSITSDMWQGDEAKFQRTFGVGPGAVFVDEAEWHEGTGTWRAQLNLTIDDPDTGAAIGAATVEINLTELDRRSAL